LLRQAAGARRHDFTHLQNAQEVHDFVRKGLLVTLRGNDDYHIHAGVRYAVARPEVKLFIERLSEQYRAACGERLVVTSLMRPKDRQPRNSHELSVHPTGMAVDLRVSGSSRCRSWLEGVLVELEGKAVVEAARERRPPHYHVVVFPREYARYVAGHGGTVPAAAAATAARVVQAAQVPQQAQVKAAAAVTRYRVRPGDSLWTIARRHDTTVSALKRANRLSSTRLKPGQVLSLPAR
jgi:LysM repeat protein